MFVEKKLTKLIWAAEKEIARTENIFQKSPGLFDEKTKTELNAQGNKLKNSFNDEDPKKIETLLKEYKRIADVHLPFYKTSIFREYAEAIIIALILALFIRSFVIQAFKIPSGSMIPTLLVGDHIVVNKFLFGTKIPFTEKKIIPIRKPKRGDIVVFRYPKDLSKDYIKRVVGLPGDKLRIEGSDIYINGSIVQKSLVGKFEYDNRADLPINSNLFMETLGDVEHEILLDDIEDGSIHSINNTIIVPEEKYFVMGDNRDKSNDSRVWGFVGEHLIKGKAMVIYFSWPPKQLLRFGKILK